MTGSRPSAEAATGAAAAGAADAGAATRAADAGTATGAADAGAAGTAAGEPDVRAVVNGEARQLPRGTTVAEVVAAVTESARGVAVAVDREVVPRSAWATTEVRDGAQVEVVTAAAGG